MRYRIALNFEDGVTRFIDCNAGEKVLDAAYRNKVNLPMDCADGVCGTCKCRAESGTYDLGEDYIDDALTAQEAQAGLVLTCQMVPSSDCAIAVPVTSTACKTGASTFKATVAQVVPHADAALELKLAMRLISCPASTSTSPCPAVARAARIPSVPSPVRKRFHS